MKKFLSFLSKTKQPQSPNDILIEFLIQCSKQGVHLRLPHSPKKHQLEALIKPLNLSRKETKAALKNLTPLSTLTLGPYEFFTAREQQGQEAFPCQVCDNCAPGLFEHYGYDVADTSWCSQCHEIGECLDVPLIEHYRKFGIDDKTIWRHLPRKRWDNIGLFHQTIDDIENEHPSIFDAFDSKRKLTPQQTTQLTNDEHTDNKSKL